MRRNGAKVPEAIVSLLDSGSGDDRELGVALWVLWACENGGEVWEAYARWLPKPDGQMPSLLLANERELTQLQDPTLAGEARRLHDAMARWDGHGAEPPRPDDPYDAVRTAAWPGVAVGVPVTAAAVTLVPTRSSPRAPPPRKPSARALPLPRDADPASIEARRAAWAAPTADASRAASFKERRKQLMERQKPPPAPDRALPLPPPRSTQLDSPPRSLGKRQQSGARWAGSHWEW